MPPDAPGTNDGGGGNEPSAAAPPAAAPPDVAARLAARRKVHRSAMLAQLRRAARLDAAAEHDAEAADPLRREAAYHAGMGRRARKPKAYLIESMANFTSLAKHLEIHDHS